MSTADTAKAEMAADHVDGSSHSWGFVQFLNQQYSGTALVSQDVLVICHQCGAWKTVPQQDYSPTGRIHA